MRVDVSFRNLTTSQPLRAYASEKILKLRRVLVKPIDAQVILERDGFRCIAECSIRASGEVFTARELSEDDMYAAIDLVADKLARQARKHKERLRNHRARAVGDVLGSLEEAASRDRAADLDAELSALGD